MLYANYILIKLGEGSGQKEKIIYDIRMHLATSPDINSLPKPERKSSIANIFYVRNFTDMKLESSTAVLVF